MFTIAESTVQPIVQEAELDPGREQCVPPPRPAVARIGEQFFTVRQRLLPPICTPVCLAHCASQIVVIEQPGALTCSGVDASANYLLLRELVESQPSLFSCLPIDRKKQIFISALDGLLAGLGVDQAEQRCTHGLLGDPVQACGFGDPILDKPGLKAARTTDSLVCGDR